MHRIRPWLLLSVLAPAVIVLSGCGTTKPSRFYLLTPVQPDDAPAELTTVAVGIGPIAFPQYLQRSQIVSRRSGGSELVVDETHRWAEPLADNFARVLGENVSSRLGTERLISYPWNRRTALDFRVPIEVLRFDAEQGRRVVLDVRWRILDGGGDARIEPRRQRIVTNSSSPDYGDLVQAQSEAVARLGASIVDELRELERPRR